MQHTVQTIQRKLHLNAQISPSEVLIVLKDIICRLDTLEKEMTSEETRTETPRPHRRKSSKVSKGEVSPDSLPTGSE